MRKILIFLILTVLLDRGLGAALGYVHSRSYTGDRGGLLNYALLQEPQILVLGSSRAQLHIMPSVLTEKLGMTAYNAGLKGQDFLYAVMLYDLWKRRHPPPRVLILTVDIESLIHRDTEINTAHLMAPHMDDSSLIREILLSENVFKPLVYLAHTYRFNGSAISLANHAFRRPPNGYDGFIVSPGALDPVREAGVLNALDQDRTGLEMARDSFSLKKLRYLKELAAEAARNGTSLFLVHTPIFRQDERAHTIWAEKLRKALSDMPGAKFIDLCVATQPVFSRHELYRNLNHLNRAGAELMTGMLADEIKREIRGSRSAL